MPSTEPRSFAPRARQGGARVKVDPLPTEGTTINDVARGQNQLHACFEDEKRKGAKRHAAVRAQVKSVLGEIEALKAQQTRLANALIGEPTARKRPPKVAAMSGLQLGWRIAVGVGSGLTFAAMLYRIWLALEPYVRPAAKALAHLAASGQL